jgi:hypothetical protein
MIGRKGPKPFAGDKSPAYRAIGFFRGLLEKKMKRFRRLSHYPNVVERNNSNGD